MDITVNNVSLVNKVNKERVQQRIADVKTPDMKNDSWEPSFGNMVKVKKGVLGVLTALVVSAFVVGCSKDKIEESVTEPEESVDTPQMSEEDIELAKKARQNLESNPELLQSCLQYMADSTLFPGANDLLNGDYPKEWVINVTVACIVGDPYMRAWFEQLISEGKVSEAKAQEYFEALRAMNNSAESSQN